MSKRCNATAKLQDGQGIVHARISEAKATQKCRREKKGGKREERRGRKDRGRKNERNIHAGGRERGRGEERGRERESEKEEATQQQRHCRSGAQKGPAENGTGRLAAALFTLPQIATPTPHLHMLPEMVTLFTLPQLGVPYLHRL